MLTENKVIQSIEEDLRLQEKADKLHLDSLGDEWTQRMLTDAPRFVKTDTKIEKKALRNFRKEQLFILDLPAGGQNFFNLINIIDGSRRAQRRMLRAALKVIEDFEFTGLLQKYPCSKVGNPHIFSYKGYNFTYIWLKHIYSLGMSKKYIEPEIRDDFSVLDLGGGCGIFSGLLKSEFKKSHQILVDLPFHLVLANYYLSMEFPEAKIATFKDISNLNIIDKDIIKKYDFILLPAHFYTKIDKGAIDVFTNFMSLQEMSREYFDFYLKQEPFLSARCFFTINRYQSAPTYNNGLTVLDYPLHDFTRLHFATNPLIKDRYRRNKFFFCINYPYPSQHFEFIGKRK